MRRDQMLRAVRDRQQPWDIAVIGGGATGMGVAVDAASRGLSVVLVEAHDFGKGTSSRSTKLVHGGVRYLEQGNIPLVMSALKERGLMRRNAPHLVHDLAFVVPNYSWWEAPFYGIGLKLYDLLAGKYGFGPSKLLSKEETLQQLPALEPEGLLGGVVYYDGQFDDARLLIHLAMTAADHGATLVNYCPATGLLRDAEGYLSGLTARDEETGETLIVPAQIVVNATGVFTDSIRHMADPAAEPLVVTSQGIHLVFDRSFLKGDTALMVPRTSDGRVLFIIPWHDHAVAGTTDTPVDAPSLEPKPLEEEIEFVLETASRYLTRPPSRSDVLAVYVGLRPLVKGEGKTSALSRDHVIHVDTSGLLTITGGKWTTYRHMAEDCVDNAITLGKLPDLPCATKTLHIHGYMEDAEALGHLQVYGADAAAIRALMNPVLGGFGTERDGISPESDGISPEPGRFNLEARGLGPGEVEFGSGGDGGFNPRTKPEISSGASAPEFAPITNASHTAEGQHEASGHDFSRAATGTTPTRASAPANLAVQLHPALPYTAAEVVWAAREEMARTVEDVLARRTRVLFLDAAAALAMAEPVARLLAAELARDENWIAAQVREFQTLAQQYRVV